MAKLIDLKTWKDQRFENLNLRTAQKWAKQGHIPGAKKIGKLWFVDPSVEQNSTGNELADFILTGN